MIVPMVQKKKDRANGYLRLHSCTSFLSPKHQQIDPISVIPPILSTTALPL
eukprot:c54906_g1_i1 orf=3-152(-)